MIFYLELIKNKISAVNINKNLQFFLTIERLLLLERYCYRIIIFLYLFWNKKIIDNL